MGFKTLVNLCLLLPVVLASKKILHEKRLVAPAGFTSQGAAPADETLTLRVALKSNDVSGLEAELLSISTPGSPDFRKWLTADEVKAFLQPSADTTTAFTSFATANNLTHAVISPHGDWVALTLPVAQANDLFAADFHVFEHESLADPITRTLSISLPAELAGHVDVVHPTTEFIAPNARLGQRAATTAPAKRNINSRTFLIGPACIMDMYGIPTTPATASACGKNTLLVTGYEQQFANAADLKTFLTKYRPDIPADTTFTLRTLDNGTNSQEPGDVGLEANLDIQYTVGIATGIEVDFLSVGGSDTGTYLMDTISLLQGLETPPPTVSTSYGDDEPNWGESLARKLCDGFMAVSARGVSNLFASGDGGVIGGHDDGSQCNNNTFVATFPSTCPWVTSVGATTDFPETVASISSGDFSSLFPVPAYQSKDTAAFIGGLPADFKGIFNHTGRGFPDIAFQGLRIATIENGEVVGQSGTSASAPGLASVISLVNNRLLAAGKPVLGFLNPWLYAAGRDGLLDTLEGRNDGQACFNRVAFDAVKGWDPITGLGTPIFDKFLAAAMA
ncbi:subtilisin-like protein [Mycena rebaudengoi]|nr:subtilisin-like protein [Mycena rebaudengoi]